MSQGRERVDGVAKVLVADDYNAYTQSSDRVDVVQVKSAGMGVVVDGRHVVTCAHVVNSALGRPFESQNKPDKQVPVAFPYSNVSKAVRMGRVVSWYPMGQGRTRDIAVLELDDDVPARAEIASLVLDYNLKDHTFEVFGFREGSIKGNNVAGMFMGPPPPRRDGSDRRDQRARTLHREWLQWCICVGHDSPGHGRDSLVQKQQPGRARRLHDPDI
jgi:hypothetical protein